MISIQSSRYGKTLRKYTGTFSKCLTTLDSIIDSSILKKGNLLIFGNILSSMLLMFIVFEPALQKLIMKKHFYTISIWLILERDVMYYYIVLNIKLLVAQLS